MRSEGSNYPKLLWQLVFCDYTEIPSEVSVGRTRTLATELFSKTSGTGELVGTWDFNGRDTTRRGIEEDSDG